MQKKDIVTEWEQVGNAIMIVATGKEAPLSDSDVIGEINRLRFQVVQAYNLLERALTSLNSSTKLYKDIATWLEIK
jgi:hypothetical protein